MAPASNRLIAATILFLLSSNAAVGNLHQSPGFGARRPMLLPLFLSPMNSSSRSVSESRRSLQKSDSGHLPYSRMRLYDDLLHNGYYTTRIWIGTPPQMFALIVDSGSTVTYVPCSDCEQCGTHQDPKFEPELSSTYQPVKCNMDCNCDHDREKCVYEREYAEHSSSKGVLGEDLISFGNESLLPPQRSVFGCETVETGDLYSQRADGIIGLGQGDLSLVDQLVDKGVISDSFSLCFGGMDIDGGAMILGGFSYPSDMVFTESDPDRSPYYNIDLMGIRVAGKQLPLNPSVFDGEYGTVLDSGTTYAYLPNAAFSALKEAVMRKVSELKQIDGPDPNFKDICFSIATRDALELSKTFPAVEMVFKSGQTWLLSPENYLFRHSKMKGAYCLGVFPNGNDHTTLLGGIVVRNTLVVYDRENSKVGFWRTNCSELYERLHMDIAHPPVSLPSNHSTSPENESSHNSGVLPGEIKICKVNVDILLTIDPSNLKPHSEELSESIAKGLDLEVSQVHLLNITANGNNNSSLVRLAISSPGPSSCFSNVTATC
ncbi:PREDICTED: aspartic proteinase CDR1 isoform X2 [Tarenaya hassleriana]|uniref:aspartic proteinase CDR1 isoform X2 n=1 Tax=Tarenaya hassleriana TaxID=28532 RepID=UPI00053C1633|nr:PREDICTED: aspartic proteinase CDR1 isoform X2 [Tarenaya hassleriana]